MIFNSKQSNLTLLISGLLLAELVSYLGYFLPWVNTAGFFILVLLCAYLCVKKLEYGVYLVLLELFIGSLGKLFFLEIGGLNLSIRIALWLVVMSFWSAGWILEQIRTRKFINPLSSLFKWYFLALGLFIVWGLGNGLLNGHSFSNLFFDFNGWLYFTLLFPLYSLIKEDGVADRIKGMMIAGSGWLAMKSLVIMYAFSHGTIGFNYDFYKWVRDSGIGEITMMDGGFYRIFSQGHIFTLIIFLLLLLWLVVQPKSWKENRSASVWLIIFLSVNLINLSRSNWVGLVIGVGIIGLYLLIAKQWQQIGRLAVRLLLSGALAIMLIFSIVKFPWPSSTADFDPSLLSDRASRIKDEAGVSSRWALLPVLWQEIRTAPALGKGFGATVTYVSKDPRVLEQYIDGRYTTFAFEWGWLDVWLKLGIFGLSAYVFLMARLAIAVWRMSELGAERLYYILPLASVASVNFFSPYANHPLGIGILILTAFFIEMKQTDELKKISPQSLA